MRTAPKRVLAAALTAVALVAAGCTSSAIGTSTPVTPASTPAPTTSATAPASSASSTGGAQQAASTCAPSGTSLQISAKNIKFDKSCLAAPAGKAFTITFDNMDSGVPHNIAIYTDKNATKSLFKGSTVTGPKSTTYHVPALHAGTYYFRCDIHPTQMFGTFVVS